MLNSVLQIEANNSASELPAVDSRPVTIRLDSRLLFNDWSTLCCCDKRLLERVVSSSLLLALAFRCHFAPMFVHVIAQNLVWSRDLRSSFGEHSSCEGGLASWARGTYLRSSRWCQEMTARNWAGTSIYLSLHVGMIYLPSNIMQNVNWNVIRDGKKEIPAGREQT